MQDAKGLTDVAKRWRPTKGGDGGVAPNVGADPLRHVESSHECFEANRRVVMTCAALDDTYATRDPHDRAHNQRDIANKLVPAAVRGRPIIDARPRRYPACYMVGDPADGQTYETALDADAERVRWLAENVGDIPGITSGPGTSTERLCAAWESTLADVRLRDILHPRTRLSAKRRAKP